MHKAFKYRIYPNKVQQQQLAKTFGCVRFVYNYFLSMRKQEYQMEQLRVGYHACSAELTALKSDPDYLWLKDVDSTALQSALRYLDDAYKNFFSGHSGYPKFHSKKAHQDSYTTKNNSGSVAVFQKSIKLPKLGAVKTKVSRPCEGRILSATVSRVPSGRYFVSVLCETETPVPFPKTGKTVGIDLGIAAFSTCSDGTVFPNPKYLDCALNKLAAAQRDLSRKQKGSSRYEMQRQRVACIHEHIRNLRNDYLHKLSSWFVSNYDTLCMEDLSVSSMLKNKDLSRYISDAGWRAFQTMVGYKSVWYGKTFLKVGQFFASSQICSACGAKNPLLKDLNVRKWDCPECGTQHDRDLNAVANIAAEGLRILAEA